MSKTEMKSIHPKIAEMLRESNAIEGVYDRTSLIDARKAWDYMMKFDSINPNLVVSTHKILMKNQDLEFKYKGSFRDIPIYIGGVKKSQSKTIIESQVRDITQRINKNEKHDTPVRMHVEFENIHPFVDGNGRIGRIIMNWHQIKKLNGEPIIYTEDERSEYYKLFRKDLRWQPLQ